MNKIRAIKKIKRQCMVRGCKNKDTYSVSCSKELGNSIHICKECAEGIMEAIAEKYPDTVFKEKTEAEEKAEGVEEKPKKTRKNSEKGGK